MQISAILLSCMAAFAIARPSESYGDIDTSTNPNPDLKTDFSVLVQYTTTTTGVSPTEQGYFYINKDTKQIEFYDAIPNDDNCVPLHFKNSDQGTNMCTYAVYEENQSDEIIIIGDNGFTYISAETTTTVEQQTCVAFDFDQNQNSDTKTLLPYQRQSEEQIPVPYEEPISVVIKAYICKSENDQASPFFATKKVDKCDCYKATFTYESYTSPTQDSQQIY